MGPWGAVRTFTFREELQESGGMGTTRRSKSAQPCFLKSASTQQQDKEARVLDLNSKKLDETWGSQKHSAQAPPQCPGEYQIAPPSSPSAPCFCLRPCPASSWWGSREWQSRPVVQYDSHCLHTATENIDCDQCNWGTDFQVSLNFK